MGNYGFSASYSASGSVTICEIGLRTLNFLKDINLNINQLKIKLKFFKYFN